MIDRLADLYRVLSWITLDCTIRSKLKLKRALVEQ